MTTDYYGVSFVMTRALDGLKVLELSRVLAGPWAGMMLADLGADVIKLEPLHGDDTRGFGPPFFRDDASTGLSAYFACCNRNKRSLAVDHRRAAAAALRDALLRWADVVIENYRSGVAEALGVGHEAAMALNPRLIYCSISGYGREGSQAQRAGYDFAIQADAGAMSVTGPVAAEPSRFGVAVADLATGQNAAFAILAALRQRETTGRGQRIDLSLFDTQLTGLANVASSVLFTGQDAPRLGNAHASIVPYQTFRASDREFVLAVASEKLWRALCLALGRTDWLADPRCASNADRVRHREWLCTQLASVFAQQSVAHWQEMLLAVGVPIAPVNSVAQALQHPAAREHRLRIEIDGVPMLGSPIRLSDSAPRHERAPPTLGQHDDEITHLLGIDAVPLRTAGAMR